MESLKAPAKTAATKSEVIVGIAFFFLFLLNFGISWLNAWGVGRTWEESKAAGGFTHFVTWCAAIMSGCGFTWCYLFVLAFLAGNVHYHGHAVLAPRYVQGMLELGYAMIILPVLGSGIGITISSWRDFSREKNLLNGGVAAYNTYAMIHNSYEAVQVLPGIFKDLGSLFKSDVGEPMKFTIPPLIIGPATHVLSSGGTLRRCKQCGTQTTGQVKDVTTGKKQPLCSSCAVVKGFK